MNYERLKKGSGYIYAHDSYFYKEARRKNDKIYLIGQNQCAHSKDRKKCVLFNHKIPYFSLKL